MKKQTDSSMDNEMLSEYDFRGKKGVRSKYAKLLQDGYTVRITREDGTVTVRRFGPIEDAIVLDPDVRAYFPDSESVNRALRSLIEIIPGEHKKQLGEKKAKYRK